MNRKLLSFALTSVVVLMVGACQPGEPTNVAVRSAAPVIAALPAHPVLAADGRANYLIYLDKRALGTMPRSAVSDRRFAEYHARAAVHLVHALEREYGVVASQMTTLVGFMFTAYLTPEQVAALARDPRVTAVTPDETLEFSSDAGSVWQDGTGTGASSEHVSWGATAVGTGTIGLTTRVPITRVYVLDAGVIPNATELNLVEQVNAFCPDHQVNMYCPAGTAAVVGCYPHATHVAGIIGARANTTGTRGIAPGVPIVSVAALNPLYVSGGCLSEAAPTTTGLLYGLEWIMSDIIAHNAVGVVNMSENGPSFVAGGKLESAMREAATPVAGYPGAFIAESGGNHFADACGYSYSSTSASDGIMVVGMLNDHGQAVRPLNGVNGERNGTLAGSEPGSDYGRCIEAWAPGRSIFSTWSGSYQYLSGTSMASPHIAGLAARLAAGRAPSVIESRVRAQAIALNSVDASGLAIAMPTTSPLPANVPHSTPYAEVVVAGQAPFSQGAMPEDGYTTSSDQTFALGFDSVGTGAYSCDLYRRIDTGTPVLIGNGQRFTLVNQSWPPGLWTVYSNTCPSARTTVQIYARAVGHWYVDDVEHTGDIIAMPSTSTAVLRYTSTNATNCDFAIRNELDGTLLPGYWQYSHGTSATAPHVTTPGRYLYQIVCHDLSPDTSYANLEVIVAPAATNNAQFVSQTVTASVAPGATFSASLTFKNTGTTTWTRATSYRLSSYNPRDNTRWGVSRIDLGTADSIVPNQSKTFTMTFTAPTTPGTYSFQWQMVREGVEWFGAPSTNVNVEVLVTPAATNNAQFVSQTVPASVAPGATFGASLTFKNTGTTTWTRATSYRLGSFNPRDNTRWGVSRVDLGTTASIAPNQSIAFTTTFTAPTAPGTYSFQWQMVREGVEWFGAPSTNANVVVAANGCGADAVCTPGQTQDCCPCGTAGCGCEGVSTCSNTCQWSTCQEFVCRPGVCQ